MTARAQGSFGDRKGRKKQDPRRGTTESALAGKPAAGVQSNPERITQENVRSSIDAQTCPWCGGGPYKVLAVHTNKSHGIDRKELRELAGYGLAVSICSPESSQNAKELGRRKLSDPEEKRKLLDSMDPNAWKKAVAKSSTSRLERSTERREKVAGLYDQGYYRAEIARELDMRPATVSQYLEEAGRAGDGPGQIERRNRKMARQVLAASTRRWTELRSRRLSRFLALGGDRSAGVSLAREEGVGEEKMLAYLRGHGILTDMQHEGDDDDDT